MMNRTAAACFTASIASAASIAPIASANVVFDNPEPSAVQGFEGFSVGDRVSSLDFGGVTAAVTHNNGRANRIYAEHDGHGAVASHGDMFWKLSGGTVAFDFGPAELTGFGFFYSDLEGATLRITAGSNTIDLDDNNSMRPNRFDIGAVEGETFSLVTVQFIGNQGDGVGFDGMTINSLDVPAPSGAAALAVAGLAASRRRRG